MDAEAIDELPDGDGTDAVAHTVIVEITGDVPCGSADDVLSMELRILFPSGDVFPANMSRASLFVDSAE